MSHPQTIKTFARRLSRPLRATPRELFDALMPVISIMDKDSIPDFHGYKSINCEIGFGDGGFIAQQASQNRESLYFGAEPYINGVSNLVKKVAEADLHNVRIFADDIRILLQMLPREIFDNIYIICPDPWHKRKHYKRRLVNSEFLKLLSSYIKADGIIHIVTDHLDYAEWILEHVKATELFDVWSDNLSDFAIEPEEFFQTRYQSRGLGLGHKIHYFHLKLK